jgi:hypothetical protein
MLFWFAVAGALCATATVAALRIGLRRMQRLEF